jgi:hypothetical protein
MARCHRRCSTTVFTRKNPDRDRHDDEVTPAISAMFRIAGPLRAAGWRSVLETRDPMRRRIVRLRDALKDPASEIAC